MSTWWAGTATVDLSPTQGPVPLVGYHFPERLWSPATGTVHRPLAARALCLRVGETRLVLVTLDLCLLYTSHAQRLRQAVAKSLQLPVAHVVLACSHTHSGPVPDDPAPDAPAAPIHRLTDDRWQATNRAYGEQVEAAVLLAAQRAHELLYPVEAAFREGRFDLGFNRRVPQPDGTVRLCWNPQEMPHRHPAPSPDPTVGVLTLRQRGGDRRLLLYAAGLHPVCLGRTSGLLSADWPGAAAATLGELGWQAHFVQGASAEVEPWVATQERPAGADLVGRAVGHTVALLAEAAVPLPAEAVLTARDWPVALPSGGTLVVTVWQLGPLALVALPLEWFARAAAELRRELGPAHPVLFATLANGWEAYFPDAAAWAEGFYEVDVARAFGRTPADTVAVTATLREALGLAPAAAGEAAKP